MLMRSSEFMECETPHHGSDEAFTKEPQGEVWRPIPVSVENAYNAASAARRPEGRECRSIPMWQAALTA